MFAINIYQPPQILIVAPRIGMWRLSMTRFAAALRWRWFRLGKARERGLYRVVDHVAFDPHATAVRFETDVIGRVAMIVGPAFAAAYLMAIGKGDDAHADLDRLFLYEADSDAAVRGAARFMLEQGLGFVAELER